MFNFYQNVRDKITIICDTIKLAKYNISLILIHLLLTLFLILIFHGIIVSQISTWFQIRNYMVLLCYPRRLVLMIFFHLVLLKTLLYPSAVLLFYC